MTMTIEEVRDADSFRKSRRQIEDVLRPTLSAAVNEIDRLRAALVAIQSTRDAPILVLFENAVDDEIWIDIRRVEAVIGIKVPRGGNLTEIVMRSGDRHLVRQTADRVFEAIEAHVGSVRAKEHA